MANRLQEWTGQRRLLILIIAVLLVIGAAAVVIAIVFWKPQTGQVKGNTIPLVVATSTTGGKRLTLSLSLRATAIWTKAAMDSFSSG